MEPPERQIREEIHREGRITFARFMELALFSRSGGYYSSPRAETPYRDYFTSPGAHPLFGHLLALQLEELWQLLGRPHPFTVIEPGSGTGILAGDILRSAGEMSEKFAQSLRYICIDRFPPEAGVQRTASEKGQHVIAETMPFKDVTGCILSNELLDSFPVHRFQIQEGRAWEVYVTVQGDGLAEVLDEPSTPELAARLEAVAPLLPDGFRGEVCLALAPWVREAARLLHGGVVLTFDYGGLPHELLAPHRRQGTLRCYYKHTVSGNPYIRIGRQDITAHVDFGVLMEKGEANGLATLGYSTQDQFLRNLGADLFLDALVRTKLPHHQLAANQLAMRELLHPDGLGGFKVLAQGKGAVPLKLSGFQQDSAVRQRLLRHPPRLRVPLLAAEHAPLLESRYPHEAMDFSELWSWDLQGQEQKNPEQGP